MRMNESAVANAKVRIFGRNASCRRFIVNRFVDGGEKAPVNGEHNM